MFQKWVKVLPYFLVAKMAKVLLPEYKLKANETVVAYEIDEGEWIFISEDRWKREKEKREEKLRKKREKEIEKAKDKIIEYANKYEEIREFLKTITPMYERGGEILEE